VKEFDRRVLIKECGPVEEKDEEEVIRHWRELHEEELYDLYCSPNVIPEMKSRRLKWPGHVAYMGEKRGAYRVWWRSLRKIHNLENPGVDRRMILKRIFKKKNRGMDWIDRRQNRDRWLALVNVVMARRVP
jgi:hypothetical protein